MPWHVVGCFFCGCPRGPKTSRHVFVFDCWRRPLVIKHGTIWVIINLYFIQLPMLQKTCVYIYMYISQMLHVWNIYLHLPQKLPKCRWFHTWSIWDIYIYIYTYYRYPGTVRGYPGDPTLFDDTGSENWDDFWEFFHGFVTGCFL